MTQLVGVGLFPLLAGACTGVVKCKQRKQFYFLSLLQTDQIVAVEAEYVMSVRGGVTTVPTEDVYCLGSDGLLFNKSD